jgi:D-amino-acid dehydrogenase
MNVVVLGAGVVGVAAAYYLAEDGHDVTVLDRNAEAAGETSYGNAGLVTPGDSYAWASPAALKMFVKSLYRRDLGIKVTPRLDPRLWAWSWKFLFECTNERARVNTLRKLRLTMYSRQCLETVVERTRVDFDRGDRGVVYFFRSQESLDHGVQHMRLLADNGLRIEVVDRDGLAQAEPALASAKSSLAGGIFSPMDQTGDSRKFAGNLARWCQTERNVRFAWSTTVTGIEAAGRRIACVRTDKGAVKGDAFVLAMGCDSPLLVRQVGVTLPIYPVKGYSATVPIRDGDAAPQIGGVDEDKLVAFSRLGNRLRVAATAEFVGYDRSHRPRDFTQLLATAKELFPRGGDYAGAEYWAGLRPMTPSSVPILGPAKYDNLYLNVGHGHVGWTMSCGSGKFIADLVAGRKPEIDPEGLLYKG